MGPIELAAELRPFAGGSDQVTAALLSGLSDEQLAVSAPRSLTMATRVSGPGAGESGSLTAIEETGRPSMMASSPWRWPAALVLGALVLAVALVSRGLFDADAPDDGPAQAGSAVDDQGEPQPSTGASPPADPPALASGRVAITPKDAKVFVDGRPQALDGGTLVVRGSPGDVFRVQVTDGDAKVVEDVVLGKAGRVQPSAIVLSVADDRGIGVPPRLAPRRRRPPSRRRSRFGNPGGSDDPCSYLNEALEPEALACRHRAADGDAAGLIGWCR